ncbi:MAG TPA: flagellar biosynthetic protein FliR [Clostridiaceae bacterium]|nr:flagellar biosynthetic protein FliR [Clostridiaceae bacterium]
MFNLEVQGFIFIMARITSFITVVPGFSHRSMPNTVKVFLSLILSLLVYLNTPEMVLYEEIILFALGVAREIIIGLSMGYMAKLIFTAVEMAGQFVDFQVGYSMGAVFDPMTGTTSSYYGSLFYWMSIMVFFMMNMHHLLLTSLMDSFSLVSPGQVGLQGINLQGVLYLFSHAFKIAFSIASPMLVVLLTADIIMGLVSRSVPQINVFMLGMPLKSLLGMVIFLLLASSLLTQTGKTLALMLEYIQKALLMFR